MPSNRNRRRRGKKISDDATTGQHSTSDPLNRAGEMEKPENPNALGESSLSEENAPTNDDITKDDNKISDNTKNDNDTSDITKDDSETSDDHDESDEEAAPNGTNNNSAARRDAYRKRIIRAIQEQAGGFEAEEVYWALLCSTVEGAKVATREAVEAAVTALATFVKENYRRVKQWKKDHPRLFWTYVAILVLGIAAGPIVASALGAIGFTSGGIAAGSLAAAIQASIGNVAAGSVFAIIQSLTMTGTIIPLAGGIGMGISALTVAFLHRWYGTSPNPEPGKSWGERFKAVGVACQGAVGACGNALAVGAKIGYYGSMFGACYTWNRACYTWNKARRAGVKIGSWFSK